MKNEVLESNLQVNDVSSETRWAGFWIRVGASFIDFLVFLPLLGLSIYNVVSLKKISAELMIALIFVAYKPFMEFKYGATLGKMAVKIKVVDKDFNGISLSQSIIRYIPWMTGQIVSVITTVLLFEHPDFVDSTNWMDVGELSNETVPYYYDYIGLMVLTVSCVFIVFTETKQGLHDMLADTFCVCKKS